MFGMTVSPCAFFTAFRVGWFFLIRCRKFKSILQVWATGVTSQTQEMRIQLQFLPTAGVCIISAGLICRNTNHCAFLFWLSMSKQALERHILVALVWTAKKMKNTFIFRRASWLRTAHNVPHLYHRSCWLRVMNWNVVQDLSTGVNVGGNCFGLGTQKE